jgi:predicted ester cyclase
MGMTSTDEMKALTIEDARKIVAPMYESFNEPSKKDVAALLAKAVHPEYRSYHTNEDSLSRDQLADAVKRLGLTVPDLRWRIVDILTIGDRIVVRGEAAGTPTGEFWGAQPTGKGFKTMALDIFTVRDGKLTSGYHIENWIWAQEQMRK